MTECEHLARTSAYFDGALPPGEEAQAVAHLAECAACQELLGDAVAIDAALSTGAASDRLSHAEQVQPTAEPVPVTRARSRRARWVAVGTVVFAAAAAVVVWLGLRKPSSERPVVAAIELAPERTVEARFSGPRFAAHRPLRVLRGDVARESISLQVMAELERSGDRRDLVAALAASGDLVRAREIAAGLPAGPARESDLAALALAGGDPERALAHAFHALDRDPDFVAAHWNLALAARALRLLRVARAELERVARAAEPGWGDEARAQLASLSRELAGDDAYAEIDRRGREMVAGGPPLAAAHVALAPSQVRIHFYDALHLAADEARLAALRPLAAALDEHDGYVHASKALGRARPAIAARFGARFRTLLEQRASAPGIPALLADLRAAGPPAHPMLARAIILAGQETARWKELRELVATWGDPWFDLIVERERIRATWAGADMEAEQPVTAALTRCTSAAAATVASSSRSSTRLSTWALPCGALALDLAELLARTGREALAVERGEQAVEWYRRAGIPALQSHARSFVAETVRRRGRTARARAEFEEIVLAATGPLACDQRRYASIGQAAIAILDGDLDAARRALPPADPPAGCTASPDVLGLAAATDLARQTRAPEDVAAARRWIERTREPASGAFALVATARLSRGQDVEAARQLGAWLAQVPSSDDPVVEAARTWGTTTLIADAGARGDWEQVIAIAAHAPRLVKAGCVLVASSDDGDTTIAIRANGTVAGVHHQVPPRELGDAPLVPPELVQALAGCGEIAVVARPPLHGRADLLPPHLPWWFAGDTGRDPAPRAKRAVEVVDARPPDPALPRLPAPPATRQFEVSLAGDAATPRRVLAALADASYAELHVHGVASAYDDDAAYLALSPDADGSFALRADAVRATQLRNAPLIVLGACRAAEVAPYLRQRWSLPDAFLAAGARAIVAADVPIPDASARRIFDELHRRIDAGEPVATAVAAIRASAPDDAAWARRLMVFR